MLIDLIDCFKKHSQKHIHVHLNKKQTMHLLSDKRFELIEYYDENKDDFIQFEYLSDAFDYLSTINDFDLIVYETKVQII